MLAELLMRPSFFLPLAFLVLAACVKFSKVKSRASTPKVFRNLGWFARANAVRKGQAPTLQALEEGYYKVNRNNSRQKSTAKLIASKFYSILEMGSFSSSRTR